MADSVLIYLPMAEWVFIADGPLTDCLTTPNRQCFYLYAATKPTAEFGHMAQEFENFNAVPDTGQSIWMMSPHGDAEVWVTERAP